MLILLFIDSMPFRPLKVIYNLDLIKPINLLSFKMVVLESSINFVVFSFLFY